MEKLGLMGLRKVLSMQGCMPEGGNNTLLSLIKIQLKDILREVKRGGLELAETINI